MTASAARRWIVLVVLVQVAVLVLMPLRAGPRMPSGTSVVLQAQVHDRPSEYEGFDSPNELWLDYGFDELDAPSGVEPGDTVYVELRGDRDGDDAMRLGRVFASEDALEDDMTWITLSVNDDLDVETGPIEVWFDEDPDAIEALHVEAGRRGGLDVRVDLAPDGQPSIDTVRG